MERSINSCLAQTYKEIEILIIDDGSTDETKDLVDFFQNSDSRVKYYFKSNGGAPSARNLGLTKANGSYIQFLDSDDYLHESKLAFQIQILRQDSTLDLTYCRAMHVDAELTNLDKYWGLPLPNNSSKYFQFSWQTMCPLYKIDAIRKIGTWDERLKIHQDWEYCIRAQINDLKICFTEDVLCYFVVHKGNRVGNNLNLSKIESIELANRIVYNRLRDTNKVDVSLQNLFRNRFYYCLLKYAAVSAKEKIKNLLSYLIHNRMDGNFIKIGISNKYIAKVILKVHAMNKK